MRATDIKMMSRTLALVLLPNLAFAQAPPPPWGGLSPDIPAQSRTAGLHNVLAYAHGVSIGDGASHMIGHEPVGSWWYGLTSLAQIAAKDPDAYGWLTDSGALTGPLCTAGGQVNCFTSPTGAYKLTDASVAGLEIGGLAIQAALNTRLAYVPSAAGYLTNIPLMIPIAVDNSAGNATSAYDLVDGDGWFNSTIYAVGNGAAMSDATSSTRNLPLLACGDPGATPSNGLGRWAPVTGQCNGLVRGLGLWGSLAATGNYGSTYAWDGLAIGARLRVESVEASGFYNDFTIVGDHTLLRDIYANDGYRGIYWDAPNSVLAGDIDFDHINVGKPTFAAVAVNGNASAAGHFANEAYLQSGLWTFYGEPNGCHPIIAGAHFDNLQTEFTGLGLILDGHVLNTDTGTYNADTAKCRNAVDWTTEKWFHDFSNAAVTPGTPWRRRNTVDVANLTGRVHGIITNSGSIIPTADPAGPAGTAVFSILQAADPADGEGFELDGSMLATFNAAVGAGAGGATIPLINAAASGGLYALPGDGVTWHQTGSGGGIFAKLDTKGTYTTTNVGDLMEYEPGTFRAVEPAGTQPNQPLMGVAVQAGVNNGMMFPLQTYGSAIVSIGDHAVGAAGFVKKARGVGLASIVGGSGGSAGTYTITASGPCSTQPVYTVTVSNGAVTSAVAGNADAVVCTGAPSVSLSTIPGLTGASIIPQWPPANVQAASSKSDGDVVGSSQGIGGGGIAYLRLIGME